jgi:dipeptidyl aminopeptidase/acylaminoacyl peptidase
MNKPIWRIEMGSFSDQLIKAEDLYRFQIISGTRTAPDGKRIIFSVQRIDQKTEKKYSNLWIAHTEDGKVTQFTFGDHNDSSPQWSPDSSQVAFLSNRADLDKPAQIYLIPMHGGEARQLTSIKGSINSLNWSPDGTKLLCCVQKCDPEEIERQEDEQKKKLGVVHRYYERVFYKLDGHGYLPKERQHLWIVDAVTGEATQLTDHAVFDESDPAWSPDGKQIAFVSNRQEEPDFFPDQVDLWVMPATGGEFRKIETPVGNKSQPSFSPDGKWIAYIGAEGENLSYKNNGLVIVAADGSGAPLNLTDKFDLHISAWTINDIGQAETMPPVWSRDSQKIYFQVTLHGSTVLYRIDRSGENLELIIGEGGVVSSYSFDQGQNLLGYFFGEMNNPGQVYVRSMTTGSVQKLTAFNEDWLKQLNLGTIEEVWFKGPDNNDLQGWILKPPGFNPDQKYPSILEIHGGPLTQYGNFFMHEFFYLAAGGYVVYFSNPRGGRGYGEKHAAAIHGCWGTHDYDDLMAWSDYMAKQPYIDTSRMGVTGGSYGGYMTVWIIGHTDRYAAAVTQRCVSNFISMWGSSDFNWAFQEQTNNKAPYEDLSAYWDRSPIKYIANAKTPTLVTHNEMDLRCPIEQGEQVFVALKRLGIPTGFVRFPDEFHGLSRTGRTDRRIARLNHIRGWFDRFLKN